MNSARQEVTVTREQLTEAVSRAVVKGTAPLAVLFLAAVVQMFRHGVSTRYLVLAAGAVVGSVLLVAYAAVTRANLDSPVPRSWLAMLMTVGGLVPYAFGCYLVFYEGFWSLTTLRNGFSLGVAALSVAFIIGGYWVVASTHRISEFAKFQKVSAPIEDASV